MTRFRRGAVLAGMLLLAAPLCILADRGEGGVEVEARAMEEESSRRRPPMPEIGGQICAQLGTKEKCRMENGCSWCVIGKRGGASSSSSSSGKSPLKKTFGDGSSAMCSDWHACSSEGQCESRNSSSSCTGGSVTGGGSSSECVWCSQEDRCLPKEASSGQGWGQCTGCDNLFDSGAMIDSCGICGGSCIYISRQEAVGISLALGGNLLISVSLNMQKHAHNLNEASSGGKKPYTTLPIWRLGMALMAIGETGNFLAYAYAPATLVAPLGSVSVISNVILARYFLKEIITMRSLLGVVLAIGGSVLIVSYAPSSDKQLTMEVLEEYMSDASFIVFVSCLVIATVGLFLLGDKYKKHYVVVYTLICSLTGCLTVMCVKGVSTALILTLQGHNQFFNFLPWVLVAIVVSTAIIQLKYLNLAMMHFGASEVVPVYYVLFTFFSILGGIVLYKEFHQHCPASNPSCHYTLFFLLGCALTFCGVYVISFGKKNGKRPGAEGKEMVVSGGGETERAGLLSPDEIASGSGGSPARGGEQSNFSIDG